MTDFENSESRFDVAEKAKEAIGVELTVDQLVELRNNNDRFVLDENREITDLLNRSISGVYYHEELPEDQLHLRERVLYMRLEGLLNDLLIDPQSRHSERLPLTSAILKTIRASHFVAISSAPSIHDKFDRKFIREKLGLVDSSSLSLFCDDVCLLLRNLYGDGECGALDHLRSAMLDILIGLSFCKHEILCSEHSDAESMDLYIDLIGWPKHYGITGSERGYGYAALDSLRTRACKVRENPSAFSKYSVAFADTFAKRWEIEPDQIEQTDNDMPF